MLIFFLEPKLEEMNRIVVGLVVAIAGVSAILAAQNVNSSPKKVDWAKLEPTIHNLLTKTPTPKSAGYILTDPQGNKEDCHRLFDTYRNQEGYTVKQWACWSKE